eukprot:TRINITY_DN13257_c0_g1_i1.p1 TRINITY_DN13257_c0_g1~~TRINITY_DN13257_c0_g1_i1.p1  ORF type:complete len:98 (-),score=16.19 TRINITY_DN13257_c0_g1_i1:44-337(-)
MMEMTRPPMTTALMADAKEQILVLPILAPTQNNVLENSGSCFSKRWSKTVLVTLGSLRALCVMMEMNTPQMTTAVAACVLEQILVQQILAPNTEQCS